MNLRDSLKLKKLNYGSVLQFHPKPQHSIDLMEKYKDQNGTQFSYRGLVQHFNGVLVRNIPLAQRVLQGPQGKSLPLPKHHQVNITEEEKDGGLSQNGTVLIQQHASTQK